ncbi:hypothetical protein V8D89_004534 [Ganoderma adspersum]
MSITLLGSILPATVTSLPPTVTSSDSPLPTPVPSFAWSSLPATFDTCTSATLKWAYSGTPDVIQFILVPQASSHANTTIASKRSADNTTIATRVDPSALAWTWPKVNASAGEYVLQASGTWVNTASSSFVINNGADTSCLAAAVVSATSTTSSPGPSNSITPIPTTSTRRTPNVGVIAGGAVAGVIVLIIALLGYRVWARRRRRRQHLQAAPPRYPTEATHRSLPPLYVAPANPTYPLTEKDTGRTEPLDNAVDVDSSLSPNRRPSSFLHSGSEPYTPVPPYTSCTPARGRNEDVSTIGSRSSAALSDATTTAGLMRTFSSTCPPSYATSPSPPPSYATDTARGATAPPSAHLSYASSS